MENYLSYCVQLLTLIVSVTAIIIAYKTFIRQRTFDNENHLFKYKIEKYNDVLSCMVENVTFLKKHVVDYYSNLGLPHLREEYFEDLQDLINDKIEETELVLISKVVFVSEDVVKEVEKYVEFAWDANFVNSNYDPNYDESKVVDNRKRDIDNVYNLEDIMYDIAEVMRIDSGVEPLAKKLDTRLGQKKLAAQTGRWKKVV